MLSIKAKMDDLVKDVPHLTACDLESLVLVDNEETATEFILSKFPSIFYIAHLTGLVMTQYFCQLIPQMFQSLHAEMVVLLTQTVLGFLMKFTASRHPFQSVHHNWRMNYPAFLHLCSS